MAFSTTEAPIYGGGRLEIEFGEDTPLSSLAAYYVIYKGTKQRHIATAKIISPSKLHSTIPGHNEAEVVQVNVVDFQGNQITSLATNNFTFHKDGTLHLAEFLLSSVCSTNALEDLELIKSEHFSLADEDLSTLDDRLTKALSYLKFPDWWSLLGPESSSDHPEPRESLIHFTARLGLINVTTLLLHKPGSEVALQLANHKGHLPRDVALDNGHNRLAELLSDLLPLGQRFDTDGGVVHGRDPEAVSLTCDLQTHDRTIEEDIIVLQGVEKGGNVDQGLNVSRQWETDWPETGASTHVNTDGVEGTDGIVLDSADETYKSVCDKAQQLHTLVSTDNQDFPDNQDHHSNQNNPNNQGYPSNQDLPNNHDHQGNQTYTEQPFTQPNLGDNGSEGAELKNVADESNVYPADVNEADAEDCDLDLERDPVVVAMDEDELHITEGEEDEVQGFMEGSIAVLHKLNAQLHRQEKTKVFKRILEEQDVRKEKLARFSSSCPSLDVDCRNSPLPVIDEAELCKSMVDLADDNVPDNAAVSPTSLYSGDAFSSGPDIADGTDRVHIIVDGASTGSSSDYGLQGREYDHFLKAYYGGNVPQVRRRSCSPPEQPDITGGGNRDEADAKSSMLIHGNTSCSLMPGEEDTDDDSFRSRDDVSGSDTNLSSGTDAYRRPFHSAGDIDTHLSQHDTQHNKDGHHVLEEATERGGRGQVNTNRYSADVDQLMKLNKQARFSGTQLDTMAMSAHSGVSTEEDNRAELLGSPNGKITKALSMSSIPAATSDKHHRGMSYKDKHPTNFSNDTSNASSQKGGKEKEEKKRKQSVFSRIHSSYRIKKNKDKEGKEGKSKSSSHRFVSVSFSNATTCDVCHKLLTNKSALRCQMCLVNVHENSCKEHITACDKQKLKSSHMPRQSSGESDSSSVVVERNAITPGVSILRPSFSFKENSSGGRPHTAYTGAATTPVPMTAPIQPETAQQLQASSAQLQRRSLPTPSRAIAEEREGENGGSRLDLGPHSHLSDGHSMSQSTESLDEVDNVQEVSYDDVELGHLETEEPETWTETIDKKTLKKMNPKDIKRQDTIWELIQTERQYCKRLKTLQIFFRDGLLKEAQWTRRTIDGMFPELDDLISIHLHFLHQLQDLQSRRPDRLIEEIGPALNEQFTGESSDQMKASYGVFCSRHLKAVQNYKDLFAKDRKFQQFIKSRSHHPLCKKREVPDFILYITQRPTKYPTLIEGVIKCTKDKKDRESLLHALDRSKEVLQSVDEQVDAAERAMRLSVICSRLDSKSFAIHRGKKFKKSEIVNSNRKLVHEGMIGWKNARGKSAEVLAVLLTDVLFFLQENNGKYSFFSQDNKHGAVSLFNLLVREKQDSRDTKGIYLISQNKNNPEMYEVVFNTATEMKKWAQIIRATVEICPEEEEEVLTEAEKSEVEDKRRMDERIARAEEIIEKLQEKDEEIRQCCEAKNRLMDRLLAVYNDTDEPPHQSQSSSRDRDDDNTRSSLLQTALHEVSSQLTTMLQGNGTNLSRSVSSVGEHSSNTFTALPIPKRAETFAGFDNSHDHKVVKKSGGMDEGDYSGDCPNTGGDSLHTSVYKEKDSSDTELNQFTDVPLALTKSYDSESESGRGSSPSCYSSMTTMSPVSSVSLVSRDQTNIAHLLKTLNKIVHLTSSQGTAVERLTAQLKDSNDRINKLSADVHEKKSGYRHNQLEELRNLQGVIQKEKEDWELKKGREKYDMEQERLQLDEFKSNLDKQEGEIKQQKEKLNNERVVLQRQMDLLRQSGQLPRDTSLSDLSSSTPDQPDKVQSSAEFVPGHKRSASAESFNSTSDDVNKKSSSASASGASKENNFRPENKSVTKLQSFSFGSNKQNLPVHLLSATNEQKIGSKSVQQLPSKLLAGGNAASTSSLQGAQSGMKSSPAGNQSSPTLAHDASAVPIAHSASTGHMSNSPGNQNQYGSSVTVPMGSYQSNRPKQQSGKSGGLSAVLKLAEKGDKKSKSSSSSQLAEKGAGSSEKSRPSSGKESRNPNVHHKTQKSDSDVIYF